MLFNRYRLYSTSGVEGKALDGLHIPLNLTLYYEYQ